MSNSFSKAQLKVIRTYADYADAHKRFCEPFNYQRYLEHQDELDAKVELAVQARDELRASGERFPFKVPVSKTVWVLTDDDA